MIHVERPPAPPIFSSEKAERLRGYLSGFYKDYDDTQRQRRFPWKSLQPVLLAAKRDLLQTFHGKCAYCEESVSEAHIDRYRPKRGTRGPKSYHDNHYWWLALEWENLLLTCPSCNRFKASWFPIRDEVDRAEPGTVGDALKAEGPLLLDPCNHPERHLRFLEDGTIQPQSQAGKVTIDILELNRDGLRHGRSEARANLRKSYDDVYLRLRRGRDFSETEISNLLQPLVRVFAEDSSEIFLGIQRQYLAKWLARDADTFAPWLRDEPLLSRFAKPSDGPTGSEEPRTRSGKPLVRGLEFESTRALPDQDVAYESLGVEVGDTEDEAPNLDLRRVALEKIEIKNFKNIASLTLEIPRPRTYGGAPWLLFLGENAVGKSSILQAITLTLMGTQNRDQLADVTPERVLRYCKEDDGIRTCSNGYVKIWATGFEEPLELSFHHGDPEFHSNVGDPGTYLMAYGPTRLLPHGNLRSSESPGLVRVQNLFQPSFPLIDVSAWLFDLYESDRRAFDLMIRGLRQMLLMKKNDSIRPDLENPEKRRVLVDFRNETTTLDNLSDGYRTILAMAADLMYMLAREGTSMEEAQGIVIIDEIGSNLHPGWKKRIVGCFRDVFPQIQFIVTSHEPLCLRGLDEHETVLLRRDDDSNIVAISDLPNPNDLRVDQLLASEFFGLSSTLESEVEEIYEEYYRLLSLPKLDPEQKKRKSTLKEELRKREHLGSSLRDELMYEVIDKLLAEQLRSPTPMSRTELKKETLNKVLESWKASGLYDDSGEPAS